MKLFGDKRHKTCRYCINNLKGPKRQVSYNSFHLLSLLFPLTKSSAGAAQRAAIGCSGWLYRNYGKTISTSLENYSVYHLTDKRLNITRC
jgi:hypothetical protein